MNDFKGQFFRELKEQIMESNNLTENDNVGKMAFFFDEMIQVESRYSW